MRTRLALLCLALVLAAGIAPGCVCNVTEDKEDAERTANSVFERIRDKDYESALQYYSSDFFEKTPRDQWMSMLEAVNERLGDLQDWELDTWKTTKVAGTRPGTYVDMTYKTHYAKWDAVETLTLKKAGADFAILGHNVSSEGLLVSDTDQASTA